MDNRRCLDGCVYVCDYMPEINNLDLTEKKLLVYNCQARVLVLVILLDYSLRLVSIPVSKGPELKL